MLGVVIVSPVHKWQAETCDVRAKPKRMHGSATTPVHSPLVRQDDAVRVSTVALSETPARSIFQKVPLWPIGAVET